nr:glycosyltransferase [Geomobilimonas luticola]
MDNLQIAPGKAVFVGNFVPAWAFSSEAAEIKYDVCFVGRFSWEKNVPLLLRIVANARLYHGRDLKVLLVGDGPEKGEIDRLVVELGITDLVTMSGWLSRKELLSSLRSARCFAVTSHHEGFATTLLEAHACGRPAFTTNVGYCGTFVEHIGNKTGFVFNAEEIDTTEFYTKLFCIIDNYSDFADDCIAKAVLFSEDKVIGKILAAIISC